MSRPAVSVVPAHGKASNTEPGSALAGLRRAAASARETQRLELPVGGPYFQDRLVIRYGMLPLEELDRYADLATGSRGPRVSALTVDMMVSAAQTILWREDGHETDLGVGWGSGLWELLGWTLPEHLDSLDELTPSELIMAVFSGNGVAVMAHGEALLTWMRAPGTAPGESSAATS